MIIVIFHSNDWIACIQSTLKEHTVYDLEWFNLWSKAKHQYNNKYTNTSLNRNSVWLAPQFKIQYVEFEMLTLVQG